MHSYDFSSVITHSYDFSRVITRNYVTVFRNYGSQCDRSYGVITPQFDRNRTYGKNRDKYSPYKRLIFAYLIHSLLFSPLAVSKLPTYVDLLWPSEFFLHLMIFLFSISEIQ